MADAVSSTSSPAGPRLWRPAAQRNIRNAWYSIAAQLSVWTATSAQGLSVATSAVNAILSHTYVDSMDLGVLDAMPGIRGKAREKYICQGQGFFNELLQHYKGLVECNFQMMKAKESMKTYIKKSPGGPLIEFSNRQYLSEDAGDGDGVPVFLKFSLSIHEMLAEELINMVSSELWIKWLLVLELHLMLYTRMESNSLKERLCGVLHDVYLDLKARIPLFSDKPDSFVREVFCKCKRHAIRREVLQVYLVSWLAEMNMRKQRIQEIFNVTNEETRLSLSFK